MPRSLMLVTFLHSDTELQEVVLTMCTCLTAVICCQDWPVRYLLQLAVNWVASERPYIT